MRGYADLLLSYDGEDPPLRGAIEAAEVVDSENARAFFDAVDVACGDGGEPKLIKARQLRATARAMAWVLRKLLPPALCAAANEVDNRIQREWEQADAVAQAALRRCSK